ncbi:GerMN domain-containing protein [Clostridium fallax]|uniref:Sporulation and spore germination n=1 Tax=Clostridium fallax TaxID=1533 RepID=A0A1M4WZK4_9CLOT|nr:GerMN domain-containing protein [Clostridium fallax]SHE86644.1 Sporulation and spore germination [Clostridium fallax]SQB22575.1 lipoprotein [Clostridium fallax]
MKYIKGKFFLAIGLVFLLVTFIGCEKRDNKAIANKEQAKNIKVLNEGGDNTLDLDLYFDASTGENNPQIGKTELLLDKKEVLGTVIVNALIKGPSMKGELKPVLPKDTKLLSFSVKDNVAIINLSKEAQTKLSPAKEEACLKSIAASVCQLSGVDKINILIENQMIESLGGNYDITKPFNKEDISKLKKV